MTNALTTDFQTLAPSDGGVSKGNAIIEVFELQITDSDIGGAGEDKLYFHSGVSGSNADIQWYSLKNEANYGSTTSTHYKTVSYTAYPVEADGFERRGTGTLPRPTIRFANINSYFNTYLTNFDDLLGAKIIRRRTLQKYLTTNPPVELHREIFYIERKVSENGVFIEFELVSSFDTQGVKLPRRTVIAARCPWKYKDTEQGGCDWSSNSRFTIDGVEYVLYYNKDDQLITLDTSDSPYVANTFNYWGLQQTQSHRTDSLYDAKSYAVNQYTEYQRPIGSLYTISSLSLGTLETAYTLSTTTHGIVVGDFVVIKGCTPAAYNYKQVPLYVKTVSDAVVTIQDNNSADAAGSLSTGGYMQNTRKTLYKCITAHNIAEDDSEAEIIKPTNISYWEFGDICGKRMNSCAVRYGYEPSIGGIKSVTVALDAGADEPYDWKVGVGAGYDINDPPTAANGGVKIGPDWAQNTVYTTTVGDNNNAAYGNYHYVVTSGGTAGATPPTHTGVGDEVEYNGTVTFKCLGLRAKYDAVVTGGSGQIKTYTQVVAGSGYSSGVDIDVTIVAPPDPAAIGNVRTTAQAKAEINVNTTRSVDVPFGGFPGSALY